MTVHEHLKSIGACQEARDWAAQFQTAKEVWAACDRLDWLSWWDAVVYFKGARDVCITAEVAWDAWVAQHAGCHTAAQYRAAVPCPWTETP